MPAGSPWEAIAWKYRPHQRILWRRRRLPQVEGAGHLQERSSLDRRHVALRVPTLFAPHRQVEHRLLRPLEQVVEPVDLRSGVGERATAAHDTVEERRMFALERGHEGDDRVPRVGAARRDQVVGHPATGPVIPIGIPAA